MRNENRDKKIKFYKRSQIDVAKWDSLIRKSPTRLIYFESWYLDSMTDSQWNALIYGDYEFVMPLPFRRKYFIQYIYQPYITQRLGINGKDSCPPEIVFEFLRSIPRKYLIVHLNGAFQTEINRNYAVVQRDNQILRLIKGYDNIVAGYNRNTRRNIQAAKEFELRIEYDLGVEQFLEFQCKWEPQEFTKPNSYNVKTLIHNAENNSQLLIVGVYDNSELISTGLFIIDTQRVYFLLCSSSNVGKDKRAMFLLIDRVIEMYAGEDKIFDFTGSSMKSISQRNLGFGAETEHYSFVSRKGLIQQLIKQLNL
ncbi:MAG TPA: hypothetical protein PLY32_03495 [Salinivirgaceae bacterium]|nr:hypothetical protein [Salinivirgaceae bacterium]HQA76163.1 hypothetical protein [Salinivirgaceae bacterium]